jgi:hypothetical protein
MPACITLPPKKIIKGHIHNKDLIYSGTAGNFFYLLYKSKTKSHPGVFFIHKSLAGSLLSVKYVEATAW